MLLLNFEFFEHIWFLKEIISESTIGKSVKWAVRLYFYVCYGLYANQLIQFLRKKEQQSLNKEFLTVNSWFKINSFKPIIYINLLLKSIFFYLRLHPALFKEKIDNDKQFKYLSDTDASIEWRQYCLDPLCTNYNLIIQNMFKYGSNLNLLNQTVIASSSNSTNQSSGFFSSSLMPPSLASLSRVANASQAFSSHQSLSIDQASISSTTPLSPSYVFANTNKNSSR